MRDSPAINSFGEWVRRRRQLLDLTQETLAHRVGCAAITIRKIENDERHPSRQMAARLASSLAIAPEESDRFINIAVGEQSIERLSEDASAGNRFPGQSASLQLVPEVAATDEIRVVTVVAAGISGAAETRLSQRPDESAELMDRSGALIRAFFEKHPIHIEESREGHIIAVFGAPHLHEDDPERALQAALQLQSAAQSRGLPIAIGIHSGLAYLNQAKAERTNSVLGATVTRARHLQGEAGDGQIVVSRQVYRQTRRAFDFMPINSASTSARVDGQVETETAYLLLCPRPQMEKSRGIEGRQPPLIGRERELTKLEELVVALAKGEGQAVILSGEAGVGKSTLLARLKVNLFDPSGAMPNLLWLEGRSLEMTLNTGYGPFLELLRAYFAWQPEDDEAGRVGRLLAILEELAGAGHLPEAQIEEIAPLLANLFSLHFGLHFNNEWDDRLRQTAPEQIRRQTLRAIYELLVATAQRQPLILVFEDLHWADGASLDLIAQFMEALSAIPLLLLCVCRPEQAHRSDQLATLALRKCPDHFTEITLRELSPRQSRELLAALLGTELPDKVANLILMRAQGNPFFIEEMVHTLITMGLLYQVENRWSARPDLDETIVPDSVHNLLLSRVDRLSPALKNLLHHAAIIGRHFSLPLLALTTPATRDHDELLWQLEDQAFIYLEQTIPETLYTFRHILTHEAIYATIPRRRAKALQGEIARVLENLYAGELAEHFEQLAYHYERSEDLPKAVDYLLKAARKAQRAYLNEEALGYFTRALARLDELPTGAITNEQRLTALTDLGQVYYHGASQHEQAEICFRQAIALATEMELSPRRLARLFVWLGDLLMNWQPRFDESLRLGHEALALLGDDNECNEAGLANALICFSHMMVGRQKEATEYGLRSAVFAERLACTDEFDHLIYLSIIGAFEDLRQLDEARRWIEHSIHKAEQHQHLHALGEAALQLADLLTVEGNLQVVIPNMSKAEDLLLQVGDVKRANWCQLAILWAHLQLGELEEVRQLAPLTLMQTQLINQEYLFDFYFCIGVVALVEGAWQEAESSFGEAVQWSQAPTHRAQLQIALGFTLLAQDKPVEAAGIFKAVASSSLALPGLGTRLTRGAKEFNPPLIDALTGLDAALADDGAIHNFCENLQTQLGDGDNSGFVQWCRQRAEIDPSFQYTGVEYSMAAWQWRDPFGDCSLIRHAGLTIHAVNGRDLWLLNSSAPRLSRSIQGDFVLQTRCEAASAEKPALGGIVLWQSLTNFIRLDWGSRGMNEIRLMGCIERQDTFVGRGRLYSPQAYLRLERRGDNLRAFCSDDGVEWYTVGQTEFACAGVLEVGLYAIGNIDRLLYPGRYPDGAAIHFSDIRLWS